MSIGLLEVLVGEPIPIGQGKYVVRDADQDRVVWFEDMEFDASIRRRRVEKDVFGWSRRADLNRRQRPTMTGPNYCGRRLIVPINLIEKLAVERHQSRAALFWRERTLLFRWLCRYSTSFYTGISDVIHGSHMLRYKSHKS